MSVHDFRTTVPGHFPEARPDRQDAGQVVRVAGGAEGYRGRKGSSAKRNYLPAKEGDGQSRIMTCGTIWRD